RPSSDEERAVGGGRRQQATDEGRASDEHHGRVHAVHRRTLPSRPREEGGAVTRATSTSRPKPQSIEAIEKVALELFRERGFEETPVEDIAAAAGISRRTFFRYFGSKSDIVFGNFELLLDDLEQWLASAPDDRPMFDVIADATMRFNRVH